MPPWQQKSLGTLYLKVLFSYFYFLILERNVLACVIAGFLSNISNELYRLCHIF
jgi:hypothetical protein